MHCGCVIRPQFRKSLWAADRTNATGPTLNFSGTLIPPQTGAYVGEGIYLGYPYFHKTAGYYLWYDQASHRWCVSAVLGTTGAGYWVSQPGEITGLYEHQGTATGDGTMAYA